MMPTLEFGKLRPWEESVGRFLGLDQAQTPWLHQPQSHGFTLNGAAYLRGKIFENYPQNSENKLSTMVA